MQWHWKVIIEKMRKQMKPCSISSAAGLALSLSEVCMHLNLSFGLGPRGQVTSAAASHSSLVLASIGCDRINTPCGKVHNKSSSSHGYCHYNLASSEKSRLETCGGTGLGSLRAAAPCGLLLSIGSGDASWMQSHVYRSLCCHGGPRTSRWCVQYRGLRNM